MESGRLSEEQAALRRVTTLVARGAPPREVFSAVAHELAGAFGASLTVLLHYEDDGPATIVGGWGGPGMQIPTGRRLTVAGHGVAVSVSQTGAAARTERFEGPPGSVARFFDEAGMITGTGSPITVRDRLWGVAVAASPDADAFPAGIERRTADFTELVALAIANAETQIQLLESRARIVAAADNTRRRIERDLHDGAQQHLISLALQLRTVHATVPPDAPALASRLGQLTAELTDVVDELREFARGIHPAILAQGGLRTGLMVLARRSSIPVDLAVRIDGQLPEPVEEAAYYIVSEALTNAAKHAKAPEPPPTSSLSPAPCASRFATTAAVAPASLAVPALSASRTASRRSAARSPSIARLTPALPCAPNFRSPTLALLPGQTRGRGPRGTNTPSPAR